MRADLDTAVAADTLVIIKIYFLLIMRYGLCGAVFPAFAAEAAL